MDKLPQGDPGQGQFGGCAFGFSELRRRSPGSNPAGRVAAIVSSERWVGKSDAEAEDEDSKNNISTSFCREHIRARAVHRDPAVSAANHHFLVLTGNVSKINGEGRDQDQSAKW
jgi:hypothetical protein